MTVYPVPLAGDQLPKIGNRFTRALGRFVLRLGQWRMTGELPNCSKFLIAAAPHTSIWDFVYLYAAMVATGLWGHWLMAKPFFRWPLGPIATRLGATPVDRNKSSDLVRQMAAEFARHEKFVLGIAPEGTRRKVSEWKTGFYHIAHHAEVPIVPLSIDFSVRIINIGAPFVTSGDIEDDLPELLAFFDGVVPKHPHKL